MPVICFNTLIFSQLLYIFSPASPFPPTIFLPSKHKSRKKNYSYKLGMMKSSISMVIMVLVLVPSLVSSRHMNRPHPRHSHDSHNLRNNKPNITRDDDDDVGAEGGVAVMRRGAETVQVAGSRLPDCTHACGSCRPCRLVMVSFVCASLEEAESCPMAYKCMCKNKSYPVP